MPSSQETTSSKIAHRGSSKSISASYRPSHPSSKSTEYERAVDKFIQEERDHRSYTVPEYDSHQEEARRMHQKKLKDIVQIDYGFPGTVGS
jgi:hypothetical protein